MLYKYITLALFLGSLLLAKEIGFEYEGVPVKTGDEKGKNVYTIVKRNIPKECKNIPVTNAMLWTGNYANAKVPEACKSTFVHTLGGHIFPMSIDQDITTYGELEVLAFIKQMQTDDSMMLIDVCKEAFFAYRTIPGAVNMPFYHFKERESFAFEFEQHMRTLGVSINEKDDSLDFTHAKTITLFCNGPWCSLSVLTIQALLEIGYPAEKINWYRGGMQEWLASGMTSTRK
jgi:rhodanese-related sulfurtransferase